MEHSHWLYLGCLKGDKCASAASAGGRVIGKSSALDHRLGGLKPECLPRLAQPLFEAPSSVVRRLRSISRRVAQSLDNSNIYRVLPDRRLHRLARLLFVVAALRSAWQHLGKRFGRCLRFAFTKLFIGVYSFSWIFWSFYLCHSRPNRFLRYFRFCDSRRSRQSLGSHWGQLPVP